jgi:3-oxoacyl-[acyl-carrier-protein] synthase-1
VTADCALSELGIVCAIGSGRDAVRDALVRGASGVEPCAREGATHGLPLGAVRTPLPSLDHLPPRWRGRNNQLALVAAEQLRPAVDSAVERFGADRVAVMVGTSTSGIGESERAIRALRHAGTVPEWYHFGQQEMGTLAEFLASTFGVRGVRSVHASACASSAKAMAGAARLIRLGVADAVITGGVDSLCDFTVAGFRALELVSARRCNPLSVHREGINIGEGAALFLMTRAPATVRLRAWGESSDGYHFSAPDPSGAGARSAIERALAMGDVPARSVEYINLHGTATPQNDAMESQVVHECFGDRTPVSSTKPLTGHALGAAAAIEAACCWIAMQDENRDGWLPPHCWDGAQDPGLPRLRVVNCADRLGHPPRRALSNSFAFGGANAVLLFERA